LRGYLAAIAIFCNEVKGKSMLALSRDLGLSYKASFVLCHKMREAMAEELRGRNLHEDRKDRRFWKNQSGKRECVVIVRERNGNSVPAVFRSEGSALSWIKSRVQKDTILNADEAPSWNDLHGRFEMKRINHQEAYSLDGACTNWTESYFSRLRHGEIGHHHHVAGPYLLRFAQEASWREDNRRMSNGEQVHRVAGLAMGHKPSVDFSGYWQRRVQVA
jgi:hypothetical protein